MTREERRQARRERQREIRERYKVSQISEAQPSPYMDERWAQPRPYINREQRRRSGYAMAGASVLLAAG